MTQKIYRLIGIIIVMLSFNACTAKNNLEVNQAALVAKSMQCYKNPLLYILPSYGAIGDNVTISLANSAHKDEGLSIQLKKAIQQGNRSFAFYCKNNEKMSALLNAALFHFKNNELKDVHICFIGSKQASKILIPEIQRTGATYKNVSE